MVLNAKIKLVFIQCALMLAVAVSSVASAADHSCCIEEATGQTTSQFSGQKRHSQMGTQDHCPQEVGLQHSDGPSKTDVSDKIGVSDKNRCDASYCSASIAFGLTDADPNTPAILHAGKNQLSHAATMTPYLLLNDTPPPRLV